jgi:hypothetical protein
MVESFGDNLALETCGHDGLLEKLLSLLGRLAIECLDSLLVSDFGISPSLWMMEHKSESGSFPLE